MKTAVQLFLDAPLGVYMARVTGRNGAYYDSMWDLSSASGLTLDIIDILEIHRRFHPILHH